jgi:hypothetical protein
MSDSNRTQMYYLAESSWGVTPASAMTEMRFTSESLSYGITTKSSDEIRSDRQVTDLILTGADAAGGVNWELSYGTYDPFFVAALQSAAWSTTVAVSATDIAAATTGNKYVAASTDFTTKNITPGQWIKVAGYAGANNNGFKRVVSVTITDLVVEVQGAALVTEAAPVGAVTMKGACIRNGVTETSFTLERCHADVTQFFTYRGMVPESMDMKLAAGSVITGSFAFKGKDGVLAATTKGTGTANAASTTQVINAVSNVANIIEGSTLAAMSGVYVNSLDVSLKNNVRSLTGIGSLGAVDLGYGRCDVTGTLKAYFINNTLYDKYINNTRTGLSYRMADAAGNTYIVTIPTIEFSSAKVNAGGGNQDVTVDIGWTGLRDVTLGHTIQIDRFAA